MKRLSILAVLLALLVMSGCQSERESTYLAIIAENDGGSRIVYYDRDLRQLASFREGEANQVVESGDAVYLSADGRSWQGYLISSTAKAQTLKNVEGMLIHVPKEGWQLCQNGEDVQLYRDGTLKAQWHGSAELTGSQGNWLYFIDSSLNLQAYDLESEQQASSQPLRQEDYLGFMEADGRYCLVSRSGISVLQQGKLGMTYVYPVRFDRLENCFGGRIFVYEGEELAVYRISFSSHAMEAELELDERYYREINIDRLMAEQLKEGESLVYFTEAQN